MNVENLNKLIARLEQPDAAKHFNMVNWFGQGANLSSFYPETTTQFFGMCNSAACLAGWCEIVQSEEREGVIEHSAGDSESAAGDWLDLDFTTADALFEPERVGERSLHKSWWRTITLEDALTTLRRLLDTGEVLWPWEV